MVMKKKNNMTINQIEERLIEIKQEREELLQEATNIKDAFLTSYEIRPSGRHLLTIGEELIQDQFAAIVELVKNCYDADSSSATVCFKQIPEEDCLEIRIEDRGHGMTTDDIVNKWLVPSIRSKQRERTSPAGRTMQGRKGIGRYAASILGDDLMLETTDTMGQKTTVYIKWESLSKYEYLDQITIPIRKEVNNNESGTKLTIHSKLSENMYWSDKTFNKLRFELKKLIPPITDNTFDSNFGIWLNFENFSGSSIENGKEEILPYPILDLYDYRISGKVDANGKGLLIYENQRVRNGVIENIDIDYGSTDCGELIIDIRVYDRDKDALEQLIQRGLKDEGTGNYVSNLQARQLLNAANGIGVYRNGFRIRPLGDADFDWLTLNEQRVQNPSMRIGSNQVAGYVHVESEEISGLEEKSARDGLKSNHSYDQLKHITREVLSELEKRRFIYRRIIDLSKPNKKIERQLESLYDYSSLMNSVSGLLKKTGLSTEVIEEISNIISDEEEKKNNTVEEIKRAVAMYQGQATLGKIINIVLHEGRRPLNYFRNQIPNLRFYIEKFNKNPDVDSTERISNLTQGVSDNASIFSSLFSRLDPLAAKRRETKTTFSLKEVLVGVAAVFEHECKKENITIDILCPEETRFTGWRQDFYTIFTNLVDNSIFWINEKKVENRFITIEVTAQENEMIIDYTDTGPGISDDLLMSGVIFEPEFTTKPPGVGTGLGLSIAGEAAARNYLTLTAVQNDNGAHFKLYTDSEDSNV